mgnify:CR=1 FL=1
MQAQNVVGFRHFRGVADVTESQGHNLDGRPCHSVGNSVMVTGGRTQAAFASQWGRACMMRVTASQELWSRGCRRACVSFWPWPLSALWPPARRKQKRVSSTWTSPFRSNRPIPASTSKIPGRDRRFTPTGPALTPAFRHAGKPAPDFPTLLTLRPDADLRPGAERLLSC